METQLLCAFYVISLFVRKYILLTRDDCFAFHGGKSIHFVKCSILIHKLYVVLGCLEVNLLQTEKKNTEAKKLPYSGCCNDSYEENSPPA